MPLVIFDLDGVIYRGTRLLPHVEATLTRLHRSGWATIFATNGTTLTRDGYRDRLASLGLTVDPGRIVSGASATAAHLARRDQPPRDLLVVGTDGFRTELRAAGLNVRARVRPGGRRSADAGNPGPMDIPPDSVIVGLDPEFDYGTLAEAQLAVLRGAELMAGNRDSAFPADDRVWPGAGPIVAAIEAATGRHAICIGKPEPFLFQEAVRIGATSGPTVVVGDSPTSDIVAAHRAGAIGVLVLTGLTTETEAKEARGEEQPDRVVPTLGQLFELAEFAGA